MRGQLRQYPHPLARNVSLPGKHPVTAANEPGLQKTRCCDWLLTRHRPVLQPRAIRFGALTRNQSKLFDGHRRRAFLSDGRLANGRHHGLWFNPATAPASTRARPYRPCRQRWSRHQVVRRFSTLQGSARFFVGRRDRIRATQRHPLFSVPV